MKRVLSADGVTRETLEQTPYRVTRFLIGVARHPTVRTAMAQHGFGPADEKQGWTLLMKVADYNPSTEVADPEVAAAVHELNRWDEKGLRRVAVGLYHFPEQRDVVLAGITPKDDDTVVASVALLLQRLDRLKESEQGREALAMLAKRGVKPEELAHLARLVRIARAEDKPIAPSSASSDDAYVQALLELRFWYQEWAEIARLCITRRDHLIRLGLASRRSSSPVDEVDAPQPAPAPTDEEDIDDVEDPTPFIDPNKPTT